MTIQASVDKPTQELGNPELCLYQGLGIVHSLEDFIIQNNKIIK